VSILQEQRDADGVKGTGIIGADKWTAQVDDGQFTLVELPGVPDFGLGFLLAFQDSRGEERLQDIQAHVKRNLLSVHKVLLVQAATEGRVVETLTPLVGQGHIPQDLHDYLRGM